MAVSITAGPRATLADRKAAKLERELFADELPRIRTSALAWRNGLGALLAGLIGFGLVKGRSDVGQLTAGYAALVGLLLAAALTAGALGALLLMRAAHGRPSRMPVSETPGASWRAEADASVRSLQWGVVSAFTCMALLTAGVGVTWYGPAKRSPVEVQMTNGTRRCGQIVSLASGTLTLKTPGGQITLDLAQAAGMAVVDSCAASPP